MPSGEAKKRVIPPKIDKSPGQLGIIQNPAQYPLCRARHNGYQR